MYLSLKARMMNYSKIQIGIAVFLGIGLHSLQAQEAVSASGGNATGSGGTASYTVGQVVYTTNVSPSGFVSQGVQQVYDITVISGIEDAPGISLECSVYPNPITDYLILKIDELPEREHYVALLYDLNGKQLQKLHVESTETHISMVNQGSTTYILQVVLNNKSGKSLLVKTFKIIKN